MRAESEADLLVIERTRAGYRWDQRHCRDGFEAMFNDASIARWLADPKAGRFCVVDLLGDSPESLVWNVDTEEGLFAVLVDKLRARRFIAEIGVLVSSEVESKLRQLGAEIKAIFDETKKGREG